MTTLAPGYGKQVSQLACDLEEYGSTILCHVDAEELDRLRAAVDHTAYQSRAAERELCIVEVDRRRVEEEFHGYERTLEMLAYSNPSDEALRDRIMARIAARREQLAELSADAAFLKERMRTLTADLRGAHVAAIEALEICIERAAETKRSDDIRQRRRENERAAAVIGSYADPLWSPTALIGYRAWDIAPNGMYGAWKLWDTPNLRATCTRGPGVPHTDGRCNTVAFGCGIYAAKDPARLMESYGLGSSTKAAVGLVALEGRVVEHDQGYRAEQVRVASLITIDENKVRIIDNQDELARVFKDPSTRKRLGTKIEVPTGNSTQFRDAIKDHLKEREPGGNPWT